MRLSKLLFVTLREDPSDAEVRSHALMARAGFLQKLTSGIYVYGPFLHRVLRKIEAIVRNEHEKAGCQELLMPALQPKELWLESGRWDRYVKDGILFHLHDRKDASLCLGPTHEEVITTYAKKQIQSYKQMPAVLYQIQTKFRDEIRPRFGLMRAREFIMKDAYSFDASSDAMKESYKVMRGVYQRIFARCGLRFTVVEADPGAIGGSGSEEFMVDAATGEDAIAVCHATGYAANVEKASGLVPPPPAAPEQAPLRKLPTPDARSCEDLHRLFPDVPVARMLKTILYRAVWADREGAVAVLIRGDREINDIKLANHLGALTVALADEKLVRQATGAEPGFAGPIGLKPGVQLLADASIAGVQGFLCGANETGVHCLDVWFGRDLPTPETAELGLVQAGDRTLDGKGVLEITRGIEVGHIFQLGTKYSEAMQAKFLDMNGKAQPIWMGCYGIGISRIAASAIEQNHDAEGMIWPEPIAPYRVLIVQMKAGDEAQDKLAQELHDALEAKGIDVLWDDRPKLSPGAKFKDADLVGIPRRIVVGRDAAERKVEWKDRSSRDATVIGADEALARLG